MVPFVSRVGHLNRTCIRFSEVAAIHVRVCKCLPKTLRCVKNKNILRISQKKSHPKYSRTLFLEQKSRFSCLFHPHFSPTAHTNEHSINIIIFLFWNFFGWLFFREIGNTPPNVQSGVPDLLQEGRNNRSGRSPTVPSQGAHAPLSSYSISSVSALGVASIL